MAAEWDRGAAAWTSSRGDADTSRSPRRLEQGPEAVRAEPRIGDGPVWRDATAAAGQSWHATGGDQDVAEPSNDWEEVDDPWYIDTQDLVLEPSNGSEHRFTVVGLHSCSGGPDDFLAFFHRLSVPFRQHIRFVIPCSPVRREKHDGWEKEQNSWFEYDNDSKDGNDLKYPEQLLQQRARMLRVLEDERRRLPGGDASRLVLWGLSQGVGLALDVALRSPFQVGGVLALRGMALPPAQSSDLPLRPSGTAPVRLLAINGAHDWLCPPDVAKVSYEALAAHGVEVEFVVEPTLGHACARGRQKLNAPEMRRVAAFFRALWGGLR